MTIASEITRINNNIAAAYTALADKGATIPTTQDSANLADCVNSISIYGNYVLVPGKPNVDLITGEASNFAQGAYLQLPNDCFNPLANTFEINLKFNLDNLSDYSTLFHAHESQFSRFGIVIRVNNGYFNIAVSTDGSAWGVNYTASAVVTRLTDYWVKCTYDGTNLTLKYSTDGTTYTTIYNSAFSGFGYSLTRVNIGNFSGTDSYPWTDYFKGTIYLADCNIEVNGVTTWVAKL